MQASKFGLGDDFGKYLDIHNTVSQSYHQWIFNQFKDHLGDTVLEVGGGIGEMTSFFVDTCKKVISLEPSHSSFQKLKKRFKKNQNLEVYESTLGEYKKKFKTKFDTVLYINVLEHIQDDISELELARSVLKPGGKIIIFVPALETLYSLRDFKVGHFRRYYKNELKRKLLLSGFNKNAQIVYYFDLVGAFLWFLKFKILPSDKISSRKISLFNKVFVPISKMIQNKFLPTGKNLIAISTKL